MSRAARIASTASLAEPLRTRVQAELERRGHAPLLRRAEVTDIFLTWWRRFQYEPTIFTREHVFDAVRKWRVDLACLTAKVAVELDGGTWIRGRHQRPGKNGYNADCCKLNSATAQGWAVLRFTPELLAADPECCCQLVRDLIAERLRGRAHV